MLKINKICLEENIRLSKISIGEHSFGNASVRESKNSFYIKPSGVNVKKIKIKDYPLIDVNTSKVINKSNLKPSVDMLTHLEIYKNFNNIKSIAHAHSLYATAWAQSGKSIPLLGTTHADFWKNEVPIVRFPSKKEMKNYELNTGKIICGLIKKKRINLENCPGILVSGHGPFSWGTTYTKAVTNLILIETIAKMAFISKKIGIKKKIPKYISNLHYNRKNSKKKYYGQ